jgi:signal transduction histidine kinase
LAVIDTEPRTLSLFQQNSLALIARQIVDQLELRTAYRELAALRAQEQSFEARLWREKADESQRLAAELHDGVGQELAGISLLIGAALQQARDGDSLLVPLLEEVNRLLASTIETCRSTAEEHGGFLVRKEGLVGALARVMDRLDQAGGARFALARPAVPIECLDELTSYHLYRVIGEAIANAHRHSGAKTIGVRSFHGDGKVIFEIEDDGAGDRRRAAARDGIGKSVMAYRARAIGAQLEFAEGSTGGVSVRCALPCGCARRPDSTDASRTGT